MAAPTLPPRPVRSQNIPTKASDMPKIPPRPQRSLERSASPHSRDTYARSPFFTNGFEPSKSPTADLPQRPPSVTLPSIGQEGSEYANIQPDEGSPEQTKGIARDLPLHAPTASLPVAAAKSRIASVTRTDSSQAAAAGLGKPPSESGDKAGTASSIRSASSRPTSIYKEDDELGIPEIGLQVPMYPNAGDVQAPTPSPSHASGRPGSGFSSNGSQPTRHHTRTKSGREIFTGPPGSYGLHGHGLHPRNEFEKAWYEKHPEDAAREAQGEYGPAISEERKEWALSSDDLNKLVRDSAHKGIGMGTSASVMSTPDEQIGYMASEEYASRMASPRAPSAHKPRSSSSHGTSPVRAIKPPVSKIDDVLDDAASEHAVDDEIADDIIHIQPPSRRASKVMGGGYEAPTEDLGPEGGNTDQEGGWIVEKGTGVPILASDEVAKDPGAEYLQPAVEPELERRGSGDYTINEGGFPSYQSGKRSRPTSRSSSIQAGPQALLRAPSHEEHDRLSTPLEDVKEYDPLFPEDDRDRTKEAPASAPKRPGPAPRHHFPSQDVWEAAPDSVHLQTEVKSPEMPEGEPEATTEPLSALEAPEAGAARKETVEEADGTDFLSEHTKKFDKSHVGKDAQDDATRPGPKQRFPSQDIWEDTPSSLYLETTVSAPQTEDVESPVEPKSAADEKPGVPVKPPAIPARPTRLKPKEASPTERKAPAVPDRPKPQVPARPPRPLKREPAEKALPAKTPSGESAEGERTASPAAKPRPVVPSRPGGKLAALKANFMNDLNSRLQLGPQIPKVQEPAREPDVQEQEKAPLSDARKGRARGPARRKPAASPSPVPAEAQARPATFSFVAPMTMWQIADDSLSIEKAEPPSEAKEGEDASGLPATGTNEDSVATEGQDSASPPADAAVSSAREEPTETEQKLAEVANTDDAAEEAAGPQEADAVVKDGADTAVEADGKDHTRAD